METLELPQIEILATKSLKSNKSKTAKKKCKTNRKLKKDDEQ